MAVNPLAPPPANSPFDYTPDPLQATAIGWSNFTFWWGSLGPDTVKSIAYQTDLLNRYPL